MKITLKRNLFVCVLCLAVLSAFPLHAESGVASETTLTLQATTRPEARFVFSQAYIVPFLQGEGPLVRGNNIRFGISTEITPVGMTLFGRAIFTPIAFVELSAGGMVGTGWIIGDNMSDNLRGIGLNVADASGNTSVDGSAFDGTLTGAHFGGAFQFDLGAIIPGPWNHVLFRTYHEARFMSYSRAGPGDPWFFENDAGENQNGWRYNASFTLGYRMPLVLNMIAVQADMQRLLFDHPTLNNQDWGGHLARWDFGFLMNFRITEQFNAAVATQFRTFRRYSNFNYDDDTNMFFHDRILVPDTERQRELRFFRVALILSYRLR